MEKVRGILLFGTAVTAAHRMMKKRIERAIQLRKMTKDSFRANNGYSWDYVMVFKVYGPETKLTHHQKKQENSLKHIVGLLSDAGLQSKLFYSVQVPELQQEYDKLIFC
jgi:hypothetical protein